MVFKKREPFFGQTDHQTDHEKSFLLIDHGKSTTVVVCVSIGANVIKYSEKSIS